MRVALYARVSKDDASSEGKLQDPENQLLPMRKFCESMSWDVVGTYTDYASGGDSNRPEFQKMLGKVRQRHFDMVLVWSLDRFSREGMTNTLNYIKTLRDYKTGLKSVQESWLDTSQQGISDLLLGIFSWVAEQEKKRISERTKAALAKKKFEGVKLGRPHMLNSKSIIERRELIWSDHNNGMSINKLCKKYMISHYTIRRLIDAGRLKGGVK